jgi:hypothetical protein
LYPRFTVFEFVDYLAMLKELEDPAERHRRVRTALEAVELEDLARRKIPTRRHAPGRDRPGDRGRPRAAAAGRADHRAGPRAADALPPADRRHRRAPHGGGAYRVLGPRPSPLAEPATPTVEDGYLLVTARSRKEAAA